MAWFDLKRFDWLVIFNFTPSRKAKCTGSLLTRNWMISAAHCAGKKDLINESECGHGLMADTRCERTSMGDLKVTFVGMDHLPKVFYGVSSLDDRNR